MRPVRIIIIDDDPDDSALALRVLSAEPGCQARRVSSATQFADELMGGQFDAVLLEAKTQWSDGLDIARTVRKSMPAKAVVLFTRATGDALFSEAIAAGLDGYVPKGSRGFAQLAETMRAACERAALRARPEEGPFRQLLEKTTSALVFQCTLEGKLLQASGPFSTLTGLGASDPGVGSFLDRVFPADRREAALDRLQKSGVVRLSDVPIGRPGTKEVRCTLKAVLSTTATGQRIVTGTLDVTSSATSGPKSIAPLTRPPLGPQSIGPTRRLQAVATPPPAPPSMVPSKREETPALAQRALHAAHDLKEPLRTLVHYSDLLKTRYRGQLDSDADEYLTFVHEAAVRMRGQVSRLFADSAEVSGGAGRSADTLAVLERVVKYLRASITAIKAEVTHGPLPALPIAEEDLVQILQNLVGNALKFHGDAPPKVHVDVARTGSEWLVSVEDNGVGIASEDMPRLFSMFERGRRTQGVPGTGIGLALCKNIAERNGGRIWASRNVNGGTTFFFTLPQADEAFGT
jgi:CheY-like chemotaxis protein